MKILLKIYQLLVILILLIPILIVLRMN